MYVVWLLIVGCDKHFTVKESLVCEGFFTKDVERRDYIRVKYNVLA